MDGRDATAWGVEPGYHDVSGTWRAADPDAVVAALDAMGADGPGPPGLADDNPVWVVRQDEAVTVDGRAVVRTEDGAEMAADGVLPPLPLGYHDLHLDRGGRHVRLIVSPGRCHLPPDLRTWGWALQLYALRSERTWGMGDLGVLRRFGSWAAAEGAGVVLVNPLHAALPGRPQSPSPYYPSSRCFRSPLYLDMDALGGLRGPDAVAANRKRRIDRDTVYEAKLAALEDLWKQHPPGAGEAFDRYRAEAGTTLDRYATFCALADVHGRPWTRWPEEVRRPDGPAVADFAADFAERIRFHQWLQYLLDVQLRDAAAEIPLMHDVAVGVDPAGADTWMWQDAFAIDVRVGAPPDEFNMAGQDWGLPPFDPWRLRAARFEPFIETVRAAFRHAGAIRVDHVMGLFRLFWIPPGAGAADGVYVRYPAKEMLDILALESVRAGAYVVGEDLGTVQDEVREELARRAILSYRLLYFEPDPPSAFPEQAMAAVTTHDLPTVAGLWTGHDLDAQKVAGVVPNEESTGVMIERIAGWAGVTRDSAPADAVAALHEMLGRSPSRVVVATVDDALVAERRPNLPGTTDEYPNWSIPLPAPLETLTADERVLRLGRLLGSGRGPARDAAGGADAGQGDP